MNVNDKIHRWLLAPAAAAILLSLAAPAPGAMAGAPDGAGRVERPVPITDPAPIGFASWEEVMATQHRLNRVADQITAAAATTAGAASGFSGIVVDTEARQVRLYWKGAVPASVRRVVDSAAVPVTTTAARYSQRELQVELDRFAAAPPANLIGQRSRVTAVSPLSDGSGLRVSVDGSVADATSLAAVRGAGVAVFVDVANPTPITRANDSPPYYGGALTINSTTNRGCSTGFGVFAGARTLMLSAAHCARPGDQVLDGGRDLMGPAINVVPTKDLMLIDARAAGVVFTGGPGAGELTNRVIGATANWEGQFVCTSGAMSGTRCNIKIKGINETIFFASTVNGPVTVTGTVRAEQISLANAAGQGDSGGPVFEVGSVSSTVFARGTLASADYTNQPAPCTGITGTRKCSWKIWYADINTALTMYGAQILTS